MSKQMKIILFLVLSLSLLPKAQADNTGMPADKMALRYRIEFLDDKEWKPVKDSKTFKRNHTIRFRFMSNVAGTLYVLNSSEGNTSLHPVFTEGKGAGLRRELGLGTHIGANEVGIFPNPEKGGGLRFTGVKGEEQFIFVFAPDESGDKRDLLAIPIGAENWNYDDKATEMVTGTMGEALFYYFELKSK